MPSRVTTPDKSPFFTSVVEEQANMQRDSKIRSGVIIK
jgi:hypothetical protein